MPVLKALRLLGRRGEQFDIVFVDPPYEKGLVGSVVNGVAREDVLRDRGVLVVEHSEKESVQEDYGTLVLDDQRWYGRTGLSFFVCRSPDSR